MPPIPDQPPFTWAQYCRSFCRTVGDGTRVQHLELLFKTYARDRPGLLSLDECGVVCAKHFSASGKFARDGPLRNGPLCDELALAARDADEDADGFLDLPQFLGVFVRRPRPGANSEGGRSLSRSSRNGSRR